ncbi:glycosyl hydrolase family 8 [uncultured Fibrobacter sp.]|uniref:glycosyl hydrolase family 8 n=1 Tax=uncultured Fibrobacter sp. TaxID=261512 RepID=UPI0025E40FB2|nr:glycosyl hydrolase family 8 [uncultured Fibrobacter sp.]
MKSTKLCAFSLSLLFSAAMATAADTAGNFFDENGAYYGPDCEKDGSQFNGAYYTGNYESPFKTYLGKTDAEIKEKMDAMWEHYFKGDNNSKVFFDKGNEGYIKDINNNDIRSEGMSYGMMIAVQTGHKEEFDKLWNWAKAHMWHKGGDWDGYFAWQRREDGTGDDNCAPDGEMYFMMSLLFAANRWDDDQYRKDALYIMDKMWNNPSHKLFNQGNYIIVFQPLGNGNDFSDPSYDLPAYLELFSRWAEKDTDKWKKAVTAARDHLYKSSNTSSGLFADYSSFNGQPQSYSYNSNSTKYMYDAMRCAMNFGMDYYLFGADSTREIEMANRIINFFEKDGYQHARFNWDGSNPQEQYTQGEAGANAVAAIALRSTADSEEKIKKNLQNAWDTKFMTGQYRYYDGLVHYLAMLHLSGNFKIWKPKPTVEEKSVEASEYCGVKIEKDTTFYAFEDCKLYKVSAKPVTNAISAKIQLNNAVRVWSTNSAIVIENAVVGTKFAVTDLNGRVLKSAKTSSAMQEVRINSRGNFLVIVGDKTYKVVK